jgi:hypothetical protein
LDCFSTLAGQNSMQIPQPLQYLSSMCSVGMIGQSPNSLAEASRA